MALHVVTWSIVLLFPYFISSAEERYRIGPLPGFFFSLSGMVHVVIFYTNCLWLYPRLLNRKYWWVYILSVLSLVLLSVGVKFYVLETWFADDWANAKTHVLFPSVVVMVVSVLYSVTVDKIRGERLQKENELNRVGMELKLLRYQVSPHFLFNVLTNLVALARKRSEHVEGALLMLSGLMRYSLYDAGKKISVRQEAEYLTSYVALQRLRFGGELEVTVDTSIADIEQRFIEPMLLIPFVENAFKHGTEFIDIYLGVEGDGLVFRVANRFFRGDVAKDGCSGIGLSNVRARLEMVYGGKYNLEIRKDGELFIVGLTLKLM